MYIILFPELQRWSYKKGYKSGGKTKKEAAPFDNNVLENMVNALSSDEDQPSPAPQSQAPPPADIQKDNANQSIAEVKISTCCSWQKSKETNINI